MVSRFNMFGDVSREFTIREAIPCLKHSPENIVFGKVLLRMGLLWSAGVFVSK